MGPFANGYQDFAKTEGVRVWYSEDHVESGLRGEDHLGRRPRPPDHADLHHNHHDSDHVAVDDDLCLDNAARYDDRASDHDAPPPSGGLGNPIVAVLTLLSNLLGSLGGR
jgi:hypothetical protein